MSERKNIDKLFQDKFNNFEVVPPDDVWNTIEEKLKEKKEKRRVIPFWWKLSGIAAALVLGVSTYNYYSGATITKNENNVVIDENSNPTNTNGTDGVIQKSRKENDVVTNKNNTPSSLNGTESSTKNKGTNILNDTESNSKNQIVSSGLDQQNSKSNGISSDNKKEKNKRTIANKNQNNAIANSKNEITKNNKKRNTAVAITTNNPDKINLENNKNNSNKTNNPIVNNTNNTDVIITKNNSNTTTVNNPLNDINTIEGNSDKSITNANKTIAENKSDIETKIEEIKKIDSTKLANVEPNALEELLKEKEKKVSKEEQKQNRWQLTPNVAPIFFSSISNGSPLDTQLQNNTKDYATNYSIGLGVNYSLNKRLQLRSGVNVFAVGYNTNGVFFEQNSKASKIQNLDPTAQGASIHIGPVTSAPTIYSRVVSEKFEGIINQKFGYIEMPVELSYKILDTKIGVEFIGGMSTLFLNQNEVFLNSNGMDMKIGEANNLNKIHFSGNLGLGLKYGFLKQLEARIEPVFKYQIRTFNNDVGDFKPYVFGIYSGISYKF